MGKNRHNNRFDIKRTLLFALTTFTITVFLGLIFKVKIDLFVICAWLVFSVIISIRYKK